MVQPMGIEKVTTVLKFIMKRNITLDVVKYVYVKPDVHISKTSEREKR